MVVNILIGIGGFAIGLLIGLFVIGQKPFDEVEKKKKAERFLALAAEEKKKLLEEVVERVKKLREFTETETQRLQVQNQKMEQMLQVKEQLFLKKSQRNEELRHHLVGEEQFVAELKKKLQTHEGEMTQHLMQKTGLQKEAIKNQIIAETEHTWMAETELRLHRLEEILKEEAVKDAKNKLTQAIYKFAGISSVERHRGEMMVPRDVIKGRIVGRAAANIMLFEELFGVDVVFNDAPDTISLSCFNLVNREIARLALTRLMNEKIIDAEKIRQAKEIAVQDMDKLLQKEGMTVIKLLGLQNIHPDLVKLIGRLNYRTSYGQNVLRHSIEISYFARILAAEIGANEEIAFLGGFFHDIGKAIDQEVGGSHDVLTKEILEKYNFSWEVVHAAWTHHDAIPQETVEALLVKAADAISASRPGARSISLEQYIQKIRELEATAISFEGVKKAFAISAGREVRVILDPTTKSDADIMPLAEAIADKIEEKGGYPGKIKVTTIRVTKAGDIAKPKTSSKR